MSANEKKQVTPKIRIKKFPEIPFYEPGYVRKSYRLAQVKVDVSNPKSIYEYLLKNVYKQDGYCKDAAVILYNHIRGITSRNIVCGPPGCGKTHVWQCLKKIYPQIIFVDSSTLTKTGWKGNNNVSDFLAKVDFRRQNYIIVFDEFDKCVTPQYTSSGDNVAQSLQSEFLKIMEGSEVKIKTDSGDQMMDTSKMTFVFCGSFAQKAEAIAESGRTSGFGFGADKNEPEAFEKELTIQDLIDFGVIPELASRTTRITNVRPLTLQDYKYLIKDHPASPVKELERRYGMKLRLTKKKLDEIAKQAYESGLGIRNVTAQLQRILDERVFNSFPDPDPGNAKRSGKAAKKGETYVC